MESSTCKKTTKLCDKREYKEASIGEIIFIYLHIVRCKNCREYSRKTALFTHKLTSCSFKQLSQDQKRLLKQQIDEALRQQQSENLN